MAPLERHVTPINVKFGTEEGPLPRAKFYVYVGRNVGIQPPKLSKFRILAIGNKFVPQGRLVCSILRHSQVLYASIAFKVLVWLFSGETTKL